ncbi:Nramp family divalent metal transporter [Synoicihabitans lomoniglobus]|uniref:Nramp family divalent metal transporter n=1 Tax=Synoicihabitans lomoniglobus TaxID=2909285 RepID=A0AAE9ZWT0_9BACT|nr:Nramp family divalent metal transporter [Opitutaceae bacterium LMO-M01]WED65592.1 Nramp family divalent metal transporter [Opitutaceae bacterium LMO-M01]
MPSPAGAPPPTTLLQSLKYIGPGLILTAGIVGTGELVVTPHVAAENGFELLWLIIFGCLVKVFVQVELGRYAVATGTPTLHMLDAVPGPRMRNVGWMVWIFLPVFVAMISVIGGMLGGCAQVFNMAGIDAGPKPIAVVMGLSLTALLGIGRYKLVERFSIGLVILFTISTLFALVALQFTDFKVTTANIVSGLQFKLPENFAVAFAALGIIGVGAAELIYYPYWCLEKGYAARVGAPEAPGWNERVHGWMRVMKIDAFASLLLYTAATVVFYLLGAAILHRQGLTIDNSEMVPTLANMYLESFGPLGFWVFVVGAFATLYSTAFAATAANSRLMADVLPLLGIMKPAANEDAKAKRIKAFGIGLPLYGTLLYVVWPQPLTLIMISGVGQALLLPFLAICALYLRYKKLPAELRPGGLWTTFLWLSGIALTVAGAWNLFSRFG